MNDRAVYITARDRGGDEIEWDVPAGRRRFKVEAGLYPPEAAGDTNL
jgi:hypothetical protein